MLHLLVVLLTTVHTTSGWSWTKLPARGPHVSGHSVATEKDHVLLFGGLTGSAGSPVTNDLWGYHKDSGWTKSPFGSSDSSSTGPGKRMYAASAALGDSFYLLGGWDPGEKGSGGAFLDDMWRFDTMTKQWQKQEEPMACGPVSRHTACAVGESILVHTFRGMFVCDKDGKLTEQATTGDVPEGLSMCAAVSMGDNSMLLFGGSTKTQELSDAAFVLDTQTWKWHKLKSMGEGPGPIASPCAAPLNSKQCIIFGGASLGQGGYEGGAGLMAQDKTWLLSVQDDAAKWEQLGSGPEGRVAASLSLLPSGDAFLLQGGWDPSSKETYDETWVLEA